MADNQDTDWKIFDTDNARAFPQGTIQKLKKNPNKEGSHELKWKAGTVDCTFTELFSDPSDPNILSNPNTRGFYGKLEGIYNVKVVISPDGQTEKATFAGTSEAKMKFGNTPGPLVGQWGAETPPPPGLGSPSRGGGSVAVDNDR